MGCAVTIIRCGERGSPHPNAIETVFVLFRACRHLSVVVTNATAALKCRLSPTIAGPKLRVRRAGTKSGPALAGPLSHPKAKAYCTALIMSKIGRYIATTMPPTTTPRNTIITGSISASSPDTAASTSSS
jgi:hypothetical protein